MFPESIPDCCTGIVLNHDELRILWTCDVYTYQYRRKCTFYIEEIIAVHDEDYTTLCIWRSVR